MSGEQDPPLTPAPEAPPPSAVPSEATTRPGFFARLMLAIHRFFVRLCYLLVPFVLSGLGVLLLWFWQGEEYAMEMAKVGGLSLAGLGMTVVFGKAVLGDWLILSTWDLAVLAMWVNAASGFWYAYNLDLLERLPRIGPALRRMRRDAVITLKQRPWIRRLSTVGIGMFVVSPLPGSGSLGGSLMGRLIGVSRFATFVTVAFAGVVVGVAYALFAEQLRDLIADKPWYVNLAGALCVFAVMFFILRFYHRRIAGGAGEDDHLLDLDVEARPKGPAGGEGPSD